MDVVHERAAGIDISKRDAKVAVRVPGKRSGSYSTTVKTFGSTTGQVLALVDYLLDQRLPAGPCRRPPRSPARDERAPEIRCWLPAAPRTNVSCASAEFDDLHWLS
jgi:hypothetical protein